MSTEESRPGSADGAGADAAVSFLTLHRDSARHEYFAQRPWPAPFFDRNLQSWIVLDPKDVAALLRMPVLRPGTAGVAAAHKEIERRYGLSFEALDSVFPHIPLCAHGEAHREPRRRMATMLARCRSEIVEGVDRCLDDVVARLEPGGEIELMNEVVGPLVRVVLGGLAGVSLREEDVQESVSIVFDRMIGTRKRQRIEQALRTLAERLRSSPDWDKTGEEEAAVLALFILGNDALAGTLGESLYQLFRTNAGSRMCDIAYPEIPNETGIPYVERVAEAAFAHDGRHFEAGTRLRVYLLPFAYAEEADRSDVFGVGAHTCLGKPLTIDVWRRLTARLAGLPLHVEVVDYEMRTDDYLFNVPARIMIRTWQ